MEYIREHFYNNRRKKITIHKNMEGSAALKFDVRSVMAKMTRNKTAGPD